MSVSQEEYCKSSFFGVKECKDSLPFHLPKINILKQAPSFRLMMRFASQQAHNVLFAELALRNEG